MSLFETGILNGYRQNAQIQSALNGHILLNKQEFMDWMDPPELKQLVRLDKDAKIMEKRAAEKDDIYEIRNRFLQMLANEVCVNIIEDYGLQSMDQILYGVDEYDILVAVLPDYAEVDPLVKTKTVTQNKMRKVAGFIITELGECKKHPNTVSVKLICVKPQTVKGALLMGAYLYCVKNGTNADKRGILELARGYSNVGGFISYKRMGFDEDLSLYDKSTCFDDYNNLPMSVDLTRISNDVIIGRATGSAQREINAANDQSGIFAFAKTVPPELLVYNNLLYKSKIDYKKLTGKDNDLKKTEYDQLKRLIGKSPSSKSSSSSSSSKSRSKSKSKKVFLEKLDNLIKDLKKTRKGGSNKRNNKTSKHSLK
jgi:hypothetical protein